MENNKTAGELAAATPEIYLTPNQAAEEMVKDYYKQLEICVQNHLKLPFFNNHDFYVVVLMKREKILSAMGKRTLRRYFTATIDCPRPDHDRNVYKYHNKKQLLEELWLLTSKKTCKFLMQHRDAVQEGQESLLRYCILKETGELYKLMKRENDEMPFSPFRITGRKDD
jgi:hypothetical protein